MDLMNPLQAHDLHRRRWMMFVDGENFTIRGQKVAKAEMSHSTKASFSNEIRSCGFLASRPARTWRRATT